jgi:hypothetical protein
MSFDYKVYMVETVEGNQYHIGAEDLQDCKEQFFQNHGDENIQTIYISVFEGLDQDEETADNE